MQRRSFSFSTAGGEQTMVSLWCRQPPEAQEGKSLSWQLDGGAVKDGGSGAADGSSGDPDLIGLDIWPASLALCRFLTAHPQLVGGQAVCELGAGMGLAGLLCAALGARSVLLTDYEPAVLAHLDRNAALNGQQERCSSLRLDWRAPEDALAPAQQRCWRLVVAADVLYASVVVQPLVQTLAMLLHAQGVALVGHQMRRSIILDPATRLPRLEETDEPLERFKAACVGAGLQLRVLSSRATCSTRDTDPMVLLAVGGPAARLDGLPADGGGDGGSSGGGQ